jgi:hypothetical protein
MFKNSCIGHFVRSTEKKTAIQEHISLDRKKIFPLKILKKCHSVRMNKQNKKEEFKIKNLLQ